MTSRIIAGTLCACLAVAGLWADETRDDGQRDWPQWRGPVGTGMAPHGDPPVSWGESENVRWKVEIPGFGLASPIVWGDRVYVQTAVATERDVESAVVESQERPAGARGGGGPPRNPKPTNVHEFRVLALDRGDGRVVWDRKVREGGAAHGHPSGWQPGVEFACDRRPAHHRVLRLTWRVLPRHERGKSSGAAISAR